VPARRTMGPHVQGDRVRFGPLPGPAGLRRRGRHPRRPKERGLRPDPGSGPGRVQGVHGRVGTPEHALLGHRLRYRYRRGLVAGAVRVHAPSPEETPPRQRRQSAERPIAAAAAVRHQSSPQRLGRQQQDRTRRALVVGRVKSSYLLCVLNFF